MTTVTLTNSDQALHAGVWCNQNIKGTWDISLTAPFDSVYHFKFSNSEEATLFALKWIQ